MAGAQWPVCDGAVAGRGGGCIHPLLEATLFAGASGAGGQVTPRSARDGQPDEDIQDGTA